MANLKVVSYDTFGGGLSTLTSQTKVRDNESPNLWNIEFVENGLPSKRRGSVKYGDNQDSKVTGLASFYKNDGTRIQLKSSGTTLKRYSSGSWNTISGVTYTADLQTNFVVAHDAIYIHNGTDQMSKYDGTNLTSLTNGAIGKFGIYYNSMHIISGNKNNPSRLYISSVQDAEDFTYLRGTATAGAATTITDSTQSWTPNKYQNVSITIVDGTGKGQSRTIASHTATVITVSSAWTTNPDNTSIYVIGFGNTLDVSADDGQKIMGLGKFKEGLIVFKERSIYQVSFDSSSMPVVTLVDGGNGCVSHRSIETVENDLFYLSNDGVRTFGYVPNIPNIIRTNKLSSKIDSIVMNINSLYEESASAIYHDNKYILSFPYGSSTINNRMVVFQLLYGCWTQWGDININCLNQFIETDGKEKLYYGSDSVGQTYQFLVDGEFNDDGVPINAYWYSKQYDLNSFSVSKKFKFADIQLRSLTGILSLDFIIDGVTNAKSTSLSSTFSSHDGLRSGMFRELMYREHRGSTSQLVATDDVRRIKLLKRGRSLQIKISNNRLSENFTFMGLTIGAKLVSISNFDPAKTLY